MSERGIVLQLKALTKRVLKYSSQYFTMYSGYLSSLPLESITEAANFSYLLIKKEKPF